MKFNLPNIQKRSSNSKINPLIARVCFALIIINVLCERSAFPVPLILSRYWHRYRRGGRDCQSRPDGGSVELTRYQYNSYTAVIRVRRTAEITTVFSDDDATLAAVVGTFL